MILNSQELSNTRCYYCRHINVYADELAWFFYDWENLPILLPSSWVTLASICLLIPLFYVFGLYQTVYRHVGRQVLLRICQVIAIYGLLFIGVLTFFGKEGISERFALFNLFFFTWNHKYAFSCTIYSWL